MTLSDRRKTLKIRTKSIVPDPVMTFPKKMKAVGAIPKISAAPVRMGAAPTPLLSEEVNVKPYNFFLRTNDWLKVCQGSAGPFYSVPVKPLEYYMKFQFAGLTYIGISAAAWLKANAGDSKYWYVPGPDPIIIFDDEETVKEFQNWYLTQGIDRKSGFKIFRDKNSLNMDVEKYGVLSINAKVPFTFDEETTIVDEQRFNVWCWLKTNMKHKWYFWDNNFYFESKEDGMFFTLTWFDNRQKKVA